MIRNVHERVIAADAEWVGELMNSLASSSDRLWPRDQWPAMRLDRALGVGAVGGHGPVRYMVEEFSPGRSVTFRFTRPVGFHGTHEFSVAAVGERSSVLRHELVMKVSGWATVTWPLVFRPLHDALIEECLDRAESAAGHPPAVPARRSRWTRLLRSPWSARGRRSSSGPREGRRERRRGRR